MAQTAVGMESLSKLDAIEFKVGMSINTTELRTLSNGAIVSGFAEPTVGNQGKIIQYDIAIYEKGIDELTASKPGSRPAVQLL